jgi:hypothetical protein
MTWFTRQDLLALAGPRSYGRGEGYLDAVEDLRVDTGAVVATVHGTQPYRVRLSRKDSGLAGSCDCPYSSDGAFCKHCVAVGLLPPRAAPATSPSATSWPNSPDEDCDGSRTGGAGCPTRRSGEVERPSDLLICCLPRIQDRCRAFGSIVPIATSAELRRKRAVRCMNSAVR